MASLSFYEECVDAKYRMICRRPYIFLGSEKSPYLKFMEIMIWREVFWGRRWWAGSLQESSPEGSSGSSLCHWLKLDHGSHNYAHSILELPWLRSLLNMSPTPHSCLIGWDKIAKADGRVVDKLVVQPELQVVFTKYMNTSSNKNFQNVTFPPN